MKILLIEDDADTAAYVADGLREHGNAVDHVIDGREGLSLAADKRYELLIVDRMLSGIDALAIVKTVRAAGVRTPILFLSTPRRPRRSRDRPRCRRRRLSREALRTVGAGCPRERA
jgi:DNA-binding response OmpR family regulator